MTSAATSSAWHPVALSRELRPGGWLQARLLGRTWALHRGQDGVLSAPAASDVGERHGLIWLAPAEPRSPPLTVPELDDRRYVVRALAPVRAAGPAAALVDVLAAAAPPSATTVRSPSALARRDTDPASGASSALVVVLQPEDADSTRAYASLMLSAGPGRPLPSRTDVAVAVAAEQHALERLARGRVNA